MPAYFASWPPWLVVACAVAAGGILIWFLCKVVKWSLWILVIALIVACGIMAARTFLK